MAIIPLLMLSVEQHTIDIPKRAAFSLFETDLPISQDLGSFIMRSQKEHFHDMNDWPKEHCLEQPDALCLTLTPSILKLDLSYCITIQDKDVVQVLKLCTQLTSLILNGNNRLTNAVIAPILGLPYLDRLRIANLPCVTSIASEAREINVKEGKATPLRSLEVENCPMDYFWMEALTHLPYLKHFKITEACDPQGVFPAITVPTNLCSVEITFSQRAHRESIQRELFLFFLHNPSAKTLQRLSYNPSRAITVDSKPRAVNLCTLETNSNVIMSRDFLLTLSSVCSSLNSPYDSIGKGLMGHWELWHNKLQMKLSYHDGYSFKAPTGNDLWKTKPKIVDVRSMHPNQSLGLPTQQITSLETLELTNVVIQDFGLLLSQLPSLKNLTLNQITTRNPGLVVETSFALRYLEILRLESAVHLSIIREISSQAANLKKVTLAPALIKEFHKPSTVWISVLLEAFPKVEKLILTSMAWSQAANKQVKFELGVLDSDRNFPLKFLMLRKTKVRKRYTPDDPYDDCEINFVSKTNFELLPNLVYLEMNHVRINEDIVLGGPNLKMLWIEGQLVLGPAARLGFPSRILNLGWRVKAYGTEVCKLLPSMRFLQSIHILPETVNQWQTSVKLVQTKVQYRTVLATRLRGNDQSIDCANASKPLIDPNYRYHSYTPLEIDNLREMFSARQIVAKENEELVTLEIKLVKGPLLKIHCNPSHKVMDLYGHVRQVMNVHTGFDLVKVPDMILDVKTFKKTIGELHLQDSNMYQVLRNYDSIEYQLKLSALFRLVSTIPRTDQENCNCSTASNIKEIAVVTDDNMQGLGNAQERKRKHSEDVVHEAARPTKRTKCNESTVLLEVKPSP